MIRFICKKMIPLLVVLTAAGTAVAAEDGNSAWEEFTSSIQVNGYLKNETAYQVNAPSRFSKILNMLQVEATASPADWLELHLIGRAFHDATYDLYSDDFPGSVRDAYRSNFSGSRVFDETLREAYADLRFDKFDLRLGKQQVVWGEALGLRITDVVNPMDFREFILDDYIDARIPVWMAKLDLYLGDWTLEALWIPFFEPNRAALAGSEFYWTFNLPEQVPGLNMVFNDPLEPDNSPTNSEFGTRLSGLLGDWNLAASYFYAWDDSPTLHSRFVPGTSTLFFDQQYHRTHTLGLTAANAFGPFVPRAEISLNLNRFFNTADPSRNDGTVKKSFLYYMIGTDYSYSDFLFNIQFIQKIIFGYEPGIYEKQVQNTISFWAQASLLRETFRPELLIIYSPDDGSYLVRPKLVYDLKQNLTLTLGLDLFGGPDRSFLGQFDNSDRVYLELKFNF